MSLLSSHDILTKLNRNADELLKKAIVEICPIDVLPDKVLSYPIFLIINTHSHNLPGEHWKVIYINTYRNGEVFDSLALPMNNRLIQWLNKFSKKWFCNTIAYQHPLSTYCGSYVLYYILNRMKTSSMQKTLAPFTDNPSLNDKFISNFYMSLK